MTNQHEQEVREKVEAIVVFCRLHNQIGNSGWNEEIDKLVDLIHQENVRFAVEKIESLRTKILDPDFTLEMIRKEKGVDGVLHLIDQETTALQEGA